MLARVSTSAARRSAQATRAFSFLQPPIVEQTPLTESFSETALPTGTARPVADFKTTTLSNGVTVVSDGVEKPTASVSLFLNAGSRYETEENHGVSQILEHAAFQATASRTSLRLIREAEDTGVALRVNLSRDSLVYGTFGARSGIEAGVSAVAETVTQPRLRHWEVAEATAAALETQTRRAADVAAAAEDALHAAAFYDDAPLGRSAGLPTWNAALISPEDVRAFRASVVGGGNVTIAFSGLSHDAAAAVAEKHLSVLGAGAAPALASSPYVGGEARARSAGASARVLVAFAAPGTDSADFAATRVAQALLGGTGRPIKTPGSGRTSALAKHVANAHDAVLRASAFLAPFRDASLLGASVLVAADGATDATNAVAAAFQAVASATDADVARAKALAKAAFVADAGSAEATARRVAHGGAADPASTVAALDAVTTADVKRVAAAAIAQRPTLVSSGNIAGVPRLDAFAKLF